MNIYFLKHAFSLALCVMWAGNAIAAPVEGGCSVGDYSPPPSIPPEKFATSPGGVDMRSGRFQYSHTDMKVGGDNGMALVREPAAIPLGGVLPNGPFGGMSHNWDIRVEQKRTMSCVAASSIEYSYTVSVSYGGLSESFHSEFDLQPDSFLKVSHGGVAELDFEYSTASGKVIPTRYTYTAGDGTVVEFNEMNHSPYLPGDRCGPSCAFVSEIRQPDGTIYSFEYESLDGDGYADYLRKVVSNRGYALIFDYGNLGLNGDRVVVKACLLNLAVNALPSGVTGGLCPSGALSSTYNYQSGKLSSYTDATGELTKIGPDFAALYHSGASNPYLTNNISLQNGQPIVESQQFSDGRTYDYSWNRDSNMISNIMGGSFTDNSNYQASVIYGEYRAPYSKDVRGPWFVTPGPEKIVDQLGREISAKYCNTNDDKCYVQPVMLVEYPRGNKKIYEYDGKERVISETRIAAGSQQQLVEEREYGCAALACSGKPTKITDANGNATDLVYDTLHGGLLKETKPADNNGIRPQTRYFYTQKYAYIKSHSGGLVQASAPVWVLSREEFCRTSAATSSGNCSAGSSDKVVTTYEYGASGTANNLLVRGIAIASGGETLRRCFTYDNYGRKVSETLPSANVASCP